MVVGPAWFGHRVLCSLELVIHNWDLVLGYSEKLEWPARRTKSGTVVRWEVTHQGSRERCSFYRPALSYSHTHTAVHPGLSRYPSLLSL